jgi:hypothetical protein
MAISAGAFGRPRIVAQSNNWPRSSVPGLTGHVATTAAGLPTTPRETLWRETLRHPDRAEPVRQDHVLVLQQGRVRLVYRGALIDAAVVA